MQFGAVLSFTELGKAGKEQISVRLQDAGCRNEWDSKVFLLRKAFSQQGGNTVVVRAEEAHLGIMI